MLYYFPTARDTRSSFWNSFQFANTCLEVEYWAGRSVAVSMTLLKSWL